MLACIIIANGLKLNCCISAVVNFLVNELGHRWNLG